ncbi:peptidase M24 [Thermaerobacter marianensis DSM 12885]|uniref:Peptidase M24 n=1 Tax=Thermaerobacter marianensis (strain ATCC 700841 / DSM 12885 / JCM 10246 / 7p75a) TaxID=644966 RepID=E6SLW8_THEM7|nr:M24 family metallopeptidase [Thermaerobacter marianensis]ADU51417.1 peptidase M24 [Thermaerobacter marianensis DSM 12885]
MPDPRGQTPDPEPPAPVAAESAPRRVVAGPGGGDAPAAGGAPQAPPEPPTYRPPGAQGPGIDRPVLPEAIYRRRQEALRAAAAAHGLDAVLAVGRAFYERGGHVAFLCGHLAPAPTAAAVPGYEGWGQSLLLVPRQGPAVLIADVARPETVVADRIEVTPAHWTALAGWLRRLGLTTGRVGVAGSDLWSWAAFRAASQAVPAVEWVPADELVSRPRRIKEPEEQALLARAAEAADVGLAAALEVLRPGLSEQQLGAAGTAAALAAGADFVRYFRVHTGTWSLLSFRWPQATDRRVRAGEPVAFDVIGARCGYQFDVLRTALVGPVRPELERLAGATEACLQAVLARCRPGTTVADLWAAAAGAAARFGLEANLAPLLGHGIGLETVEEPLLLPGVDDRLEAGMVLCIEPALRVPGLGGYSIEEMVVVEEDGPRLLTRTPRRPLAV